MRTKNLTPPIERSRSKLFGKNIEKVLRLFKISKIYVLVNFSEFQYLISASFKVTVILQNPPCSQALKIK